MFILFTIYYPINFDFVLVYYTDDGSLKLGSETFGLDTYHGNVLIIRNDVIGNDVIGNVVSGKVNNATMSLILVVFILRSIGKLRFPQSKKSSKDQHS